MPQIRWCVPNCLSEVLFEKWKNEVAVIIKEYGLEWRDKDFKKEETYKHEVNIKFSFYESELDGQVEPLVKAVSNALSKMLPKYLQGVNCYGSKVVQAYKYADAQQKAKPKLNDNLFRNVDELMFSTRVLKGLGICKIRTVADLVKCTEAGLLRIKGLGKASLNEMKTILGEMELSLGMLFDGEEFERLRAQYEQSCKQKQDQK